jgi:hypothetical protein
MKPTLIIVALCSACYSPSFRDCEVTCAAQACPSGFSCESGFCVSTPGMSCSGGGMDGGMDDGSGSGSDSAMGTWMNIRPVEFVSGTPMGLDDDPSLPGDELQLWVSRTTGAGADDIYFARRSSTSAVWPSPGPATELNSSLIEDTPELSDNGLTIYFATNRTGGVGAMDIWTAQRTTPTAQFASPTLAGTAASGINSSMNDRSPFLSRDALTFLFATDRNGDFDIFLTNRTSTTATFGSPMPMTAINMAGAVDENPFLSNDKLTLYFNSNRGGNHALYQATRSDVMQPFGAPTRIDELDTAGDETDPWVSRDGKHIYFTRGASGQIILMEATR